MPVSPAKRSITASRRRISGSRGPIGFRLLQQQFTSASHRASCHRKHVEPNIHPGNFEYAIDSCVGPSLEAIFCPEPWAKAGVPNCRQKDLSRRYSDGFESCVKESIGKGAPIELIQVSDGGDVSASQTQHVLRPLLHVLSPPVRALDDHPAARPQKFIAPLQRGHRIVQMLYYIKRHDCIKALSWKFGCVNCPSHRRDL